MYRCAKKFIVRNMKPYFRNNSGLISIIIPDSVTSIGRYALDGTAWYNSQPDGVVYAGKIAYIYKGTMPANTSIVFEEGTIAITDYAFYGCSGLTSVTIPDSVTIIGNYAFYACYSLTSINIPDGVSSIGDWAFYKCSGLTSITIPDSVESIGEIVFSNCSGLTSVTIGNGVKSIAESAFSGCSGLTSVTIGNGVKNIGDYAFYECSKLMSISVPDSVTSIGNYAFEYCSGLTSVTIPDSVTSMGDDVFGNTAWYDAQPDGMIYLGKIAYGYKGKMPSNTSIVLEEGTLGIAGSAFYGCSGLTSITIPDSVTSIALNTLRQTGRLTISSKQERN